MTEPKHVVGLSGGKDSTALALWLVENEPRQQWGIFALSFLYTWSWCKGVRTYWLKDAAPLSPEKGR